MFKVVDLWLYIKQNKRYQKTTKKKECLKVKKYYTIKYEVIGTKNIDSVMIWDESIEGTIKQFIKLWDNLYNESAIVKIECQY